jgi:hypothetical protein
VKRSISIAIASLALLLLVVGGVASCKQGEGERCQVTADCEEPLTCSAGEGVCVLSATSDIDAMPPIPIDAMPDAMPDVMPDTM